MRSTRALLTALGPCAALALPGTAVAQTGGPYDLSWNTQDGGGGTSSGGPYAITGVIGQPDAGPPLSGGNETLSGGFLPSAAVPCYANCDGSTSLPVLNVQDFSCFLVRFASGDLYANCDGSTQPPVLNVADFGCFLTRYSAGCP
jgi:hypothetical protein